MNRVESNRWQPKRKNRLIPIKHAGRNEAASLDAAQQTIKALLKLGKDRGFVTHDELNAALPAEEYTSEQIDDVMSTLNEMGVSVVDSAESDDDTDEAEDGNEDGRASGNCRTVMYLEQMIRCACICVRWAVLSCCRVKAKSPLQNALRLAVK